VSSAQVAKLEALLARVQSRRLEPGLRLVDAPVDTSSSAPAASVAVDDDLAFDEPATIPPPAAASSSLLTLDEPILAAAPVPTVTAPVSAVAVPASAPVSRTTLQVDEDLDDLVEVAPVASVAPVGSAAAEPVEDALVTAVARPAPVMQLDEPVAAAPIAVAPVAAELAPTPASGPVVMQAPVPVASGPIASFVGTPQRHAVTFGELVGLAMSLTTR